MSKSSQLNQENNSKIISAYWEGYMEHNTYPYPLCHIPENVEIIPIAFIAPTSDSNWELGIAGSVYSENEIFNWINQINERGLGQKVLFSLLDTPQVHWDEINLDLFAQNVANTINLKGLGGVDIDAESGMDPKNYVNCFVNLIKYLRKYLNDDKIITYTCYTMSNYDSNILDKVKNDIDLVHTMAYFDGITGMEHEFNFYGNLVGYDRVSIGVRTTQTSLNEVQEIAQKLNEMGYHKMMLWSLTQDVPKITNKPQNTYLDTINKYI